MLIFGFFAGYIGWYSAFERPAHRYSLDFDGAVWVGTGKQGPHGYFVKEIFIPDEVADSWLEVAATDSVDIFINGTKIASDTFISMNASGVHDATGKILQGKNVIAAFVHRSSYPGGPRLLLKGAYTDISGRKHPFFSDETWMFSTIYETQGQGNIPWYSADFDHSRWESVELEGKWSDYPVFGSQFPPYLVADMPSGKWIWHPDNGVRTAYFSRRITLKHPPNDAIIGISATSTYDLAVNGVVVARGAAFNKTLDIYSITQLLRPGSNTITIGVESYGSIPGLLVEGLMQDEADIIDIRSDRTWKTASFTSSEGYPLDAGSSVWRSPDIVGSYPSLPWGILTKNFKYPDIPMTYFIKRYLVFGLFVSLTVFIAIFFWASAAFMLARISGSSLKKGLMVDGIFHLPPLLLLIFIYLLKFDVRYDISFPFSLKYIAMSVVLLFLQRLIGFTRIIRQKTVMYVPTESEKLKLFWPAIVAVLMVAGLALRLHDLDYASLSHDEISLMQYTEGLFQTGVPSKKIGPFVKPLTTYELLPYSISIPVLILGSGDFAARLHSVFWGTLEILLIYLLGKSMFNKATGILAAAIYAFHPWCINWGQNVFYPQFVQFLTTLTILFYYRAISSSPMSRKYLYLTAASFSLMYLGWEGSGFVLISMFMATLAHKGSDISWLKNRYLWTSFAFVFITVFIQQARRMLYQDPYLVLGAKISDIGMPTLYFLDSMYDPYYYVNIFLFAENNWMLTVVLIAGTAFTLREKPLRYLYVILLGTVFFMTNFLQVTSSRYVYHLEPFLILIASSVIFIFIERLKGIVEREDFIPRSGIALSAVAMSFILFAASNNTLLRLYLLSKNPNDPPNLIRQYVYWNDYRTTSSFLQANVRRGDVIFSMTPHTLKYYADYSGDYSLTTLMGKAMIYDISGHYPGFLDKYMGNPVIVTLNEFKRILSQYNRVWFISAPNKALTVNVVDDAETIDYIQRHLKTVFESYNARIYLWEK